MVPPLPEIPANYEIRTDAENVQREFLLADEAATLALGRAMAKNWAAGDVILLSGPLGAGKTTFVRGVLSGLGWEEPVRSPTFNLVHAYATEPPVLHADLYRVTSGQGLGLEDYLQTHVCFIEWPDRLGDLVEMSECDRIEIAFLGGGRSLSWMQPLRRAAP